MKESGFPQRINDGGGAPAPRHYMPCPKKGWMNMKMPEKTERQRGDKQTHLNRYYAWRIIEAVATPPPKELRKLSSKEYAKISRKEIKEIFRYTISLLEKMGINSLDDVKF